LVGIENLFLFRRLMKMLVNLWACFVLWMLGPLSLAAQCGPDVDGDGVCDFVFVPGPASATLLGTVWVDGESAEEGAWVLAFDPNDQCVGASPLIPFEGFTYLSLPLYGDDMTTTLDEGMNAGELFTLKVYQPNDDALITLGAGGTTWIAGWMNTNGAPLPGWTDPTMAVEFSSSMCPGDFDGSGALEVTDLLSFLGAFGGTCVGCVADLDGDGAVQVADLLNLLSLFGSSC
jgi:hypothetical protein